MPAITVDSFLPGSLRRDGCVHVLGLRFVLPLDVAASLMSAVAAEAIRSERQCWTRGFARLLCQLSIAYVDPFSDGPSRSPRYRFKCTSFHFAAAATSASRSDSGRCSKWLVLLIKRERRCGVTSCALWSRPEDVYSSAPPAGPRRARLTISPRSSGRWKIKRRSPVQRWMGQRRRRLDFLQTQKCWSSGRLQGQVSEHAVKSLEHRGDVEGAVREGVTPVVQPVTGGSLSGREVLEPQEDIQLSLDLWNPASKSANSLTRSWCLRSTRARVMTRRELLGSFVGRRWDKQQLDRTAQLRGWTS